MAPNIMKDIRNNPSMLLEGRSDSIVEFAEPPHAEEQQTELTKRARQVTTASTHEQVVEMLKAAAPKPQSGTKAPKEALQAVYGAGIYKAGLPLDILCVQTFMAGFYIAMAGQLLISALGGILGASLFPVGLIAVVLTSAELFTGDALIFVTSLLGGRVSWKQMARNWTVAWIGNFCGTLTWTVLISYLSDAFEENVEARNFAVKLAHKKAFQSWGAIFFKGIGANTMVCLGIWQATCAEEVAGKVLALWFPVVGFVLMGLDHVIANQYFIPLGMILQAKYSEDYTELETISVVHLLFKALLPATLGNLIGGGFFIGAIYWYAFDSMESMNRVRERIGSAWSHNPRYYRGKTPAISAAQSRNSPVHSKHGHEDEGEEAQRPGEP